MLPLRFATRRAFSTSTALKSAAVPSTPAKRPVGAFRGGIFGFLLGSTVTGVASYFYVYEEYKLATDLMTEDIDALRSSIGRMELHLRALEEVVNETAAKEKKGRK